MKYFSLPTWLFAQSVRPFMAKNHPWKHTMPTLEQWHSRKTDLCNAFDILYWGHMIVSTMVLYKVFLA